MRGQPSSLASLPAAPPPQSPQVAALVYVSDDIPGFTRFKRGEHFAYRDTQGKLLRDKEEIQRIRQLAIPPAYTRVWICPLRNGHLQATGHDARGRKQYRYHAGWREQRDESKFDRMEAFGLALPRIRAQVSRDLRPKRNEVPGRTLVLAALVRLLDTTFVRVGNDEYARENGSYGLTTLRNRHAGVRGKTLRLRFRGKSGVMQDLTVDDPKVAAVVRRCQQLPGQVLFQYEDEDGELRGVGSGEVNDYLADITGGKEEGQHFTAKDFRTWHGTVQALELTRLACNSAVPRAYSAKNILAEVARQLGNTPAVCKKSYIHPAVMTLGSELAGDGSTIKDIWDTLAAGKPARRLHAAEARLLSFLKAHTRRLKASGKAPAKGPAKGAVRSPAKSTVKAPAKSKTRASSPAS